MISIYLSSINDIFPFDTANGFGVSNHIERQVTIIMKIISFVIAYFHSISFDFSFQYLFSTSRV